MKHVFVFLLIALLSGMELAVAEHATDKSVEYGPTVQIDLDRLKPVEPLVQSVSFLKLDGIDEESIKSELRIKCDDSFLYIHAKGSPKLYLFDKSGKQVRVIDRQGGGPEQYTTLTDFFVSKDKLYVYDNIKGVLLQYNTKGDYESKLPLTTKGYRVAAYNEQYVLYMGNEPDVEYSFWVFNKKGELVRKYLEGMQAPASYPVNNILSPMNLTDEGLAITYELDNSVYLYDNNEIRANRFDFGMYNLSEKNSRKANMKNARYMHRLLASSDQILWMDCFLKRGDLYVVNLIKGQGSERICFTTDSEQVYSFEQGGYPFSVFGRDMTIDAGGQFVTWIPTRMISIMKKLQREGTKMNDYAKKLLAFDVNGQTDLIVCFFTMKQPD